jgi:hypothetical protein
MDHTQLVARLEAVQPPSPVAWFVLLYTYYAARLAEVGNRLVAAKVHPLRLPEAPLGGLGAGELHACLVVLRRLAASPAAFDAYALGLVKALDRTLEDVTPSVLDAEVYAGCDGGRYRVRRLVNPIAERLGRRAPPQARQGTLAAYARRMALVPADAVGEQRVACLRMEARSAFVAKRLLAARDELTVTLWPFDGAIDYPALDQHGQGPPPDFIALQDPRNEPALVEQVEAAIAAAAAERATMLVFPELAFSPAMLAAASARLAGHGTGGHPILTVAGLCHALDANGTQVNEAVVLGPDGRELHRHRKLSRFADGGLTAEEITTGDTLGVLATACGNLATPICLDTFAPAGKALLLASHATVLLVPSLSPKTDAHQHASREYAAARWATTFVCNRTPRGFAAEAPSFYWPPLPGRPHEHDGRTPYLVFRLPDLLDE